MKTLQSFLLVAIFSLLFNVVAAQKQKSATFDVSGNCGMCKKSIEKAAKDAGASYALWNKDLKEITIKYDAKSTDLTKIQQKIADAGYDNAGVKASEKSYEKLHGCCQYNREAKKTAAKK